MAFKLHGGHAVDLSVASPAATFGETGGSDLRFRWVAVTAIVDALAGCSGNAASPNLCAATSGLGTAQSAIYDGTAEAGYLQLTDAKRNAIVFVEYISIDGGSIRCSGFHVHPNWVLTAAHCATITGTMGTLTVSTSEAGAMTAVQEVVMHRVLDVALLRVQSPDVGVESLAVFQADPTSYINTMTQIAGYGLTETGEVGQERFAVERIAGVSSLVLTGQGVSGSGACIGDSGGPMMVRDQTGAVSAIGVLWKGSAACNQTDQYLRMDLLAPWIVATIGELPIADPTCDGVSGEGDCFSGMAVWCDEDGQRMAERCDGSTSCGWSASQHGYRCVASDPCEGVDVRGSCEGASELRQCHQGHLTTTSCGSCSGTVCRVSGTDATANCAAAVKGM